MNLTSGISELSLVGPIYERRLEKLGIKTIGDLLYHVPNRYLDFSLTSDIRRAQPGEILTIKGEIVSLKNQYTRSGKKIQIANIADDTGEIMAVWFNQPFLVRILFPGVKIALAGKIDWFGRARALISPEYEKIEGQKKSVHTGRIIPVYPETSGVSSKWIRGRIKEAYDNTSPEIKEFLPLSILKRFNLIDLPKATKSIHFPSRLEDAEKGKERLAFDELLFLHLGNMKRRKNWQKMQVAKKFDTVATPITEYLEKLPFELTGSQKKVLKEILNDLTKSIPMNRLLQGDVGSGKTVVAGAAAFIAFANGYQSVFMAPTQILARQHFNTLNKLLQPFKVRVQLVASEENNKAVGRSDIFVGTHALLHRKLKSDKVGLVVIDEQHKFGVEQRNVLVRKVGKKYFVPHTLTMTATPIPRTVAQTFYGDLDISTIDELPKGRKKITTWIVPPQKRQGAYDWIKSQISNLKSQIFVVCPLIEESEVVTMKDVKAATKEYQNLKKVFPKFKIGLLHGRLKAESKNSILKKFRAGSIDILVSTPVIEVGIDIPNATIMLIEAAERFGLAQLHQLRGRVGRGDKKSYCLLSTENTSNKVLTRLKAMTKSISGFELAELDLRLRGPGEIFGTKQHGFPELKIASWQDINLIKETKSAAEEIFSRPEMFSTIATRFSLG